MSAYSPEHPEQALLAGRPGTYWLPVRAADVAPQLRAAGWRTVTLEPVATRGEFYRAIAVALDLPKWFGSNLDALWDCLTDLSEPTALMWPGWRELPAARPEDWRQLLEVLTDRTQIEPRFAVVMVESTAAHSS